MGHAHAGPDNNLIGKVGMSRVWPQKVVQSAPQSISLFAQSSTSLLRGKDSIESCHRQNELHIFNKLNTGS